MQKAVALSRFRRRKALDNRECQLKKPDRSLVRQIVKECHDGRAAGTVRSLSVGSREISRSCSGQRIRDSCGDGGSANDTQHRKGNDITTSTSTSAKLRNTTRRDSRYQPFTPSSMRRVNHYEGPDLPRDHKFLTLSRSQQTDKYSNQHSAMVTQRQQSVSEQMLKNRFIVKHREMKEFFKLTEDRVIQDFLKADSCKKIADKYLIAMVFAYFKRANFDIRDYTRMNFFICLYLANDLEEDEEETKYEIFPWVLGDQWREKYVSFLRARDRFLRQINYKAIISCKCCDEIMAIEPGAAVWQRERPMHHAGATRVYSRDSQEDYCPRGPNASPRQCSDCGGDDSQYDSASWSSSSPPSTCWYISSRDNSPQSVLTATTSHADLTTTSHADLTATSHGDLTANSHGDITETSRIDLTCDSNDDEEEASSSASDATNTTLNVQELRGTLPESHVPVDADDVWPRVEE